MCSGSEAGSYLRLTDSCITQRKAQEDAGVERALGARYLLPSDEGPTSKVFTIFSAGKPRPKSGLDCLICAELAFAQSAVERMRRAPFNGERSGFKGVPRP